MSLTLGRGPWSKHRAGHAGEPMPERVAPLAESQGALGTVCILGEGVTTTVDGVEV